MRTILMLLVVLAIAAPVRAGAPDAERAYQEAWFEETANGDLEKAVGLYRKAIEAGKDAAETAAKAGLRLGECLEKLGRKNEARAALERVARDFPGSPQAAKARERLTALGAPVPGSGEVVVKSLMLRAYYMEGEKILDQMQADSAEHAHDRVLEGWQKLLEHVARMVSSDPSFARAADDLKHRGEELAKQARQLGKIGNVDLTWTDESVRKFIDEKRVTLNFQGTPLGEALVFLEDISGLNVVVDPSVEAKKPIQLQVRDVKIGDALGRITTADPAWGYEIWRGAIYFRATGREWTEGRVVLADDARNFDHKRTLNFQGTPIAEVAAFLREITGLDFAAAEGLDAKITLRVKDVPFVAALDMICRVGDLEIRVVNGANTFQSRRPKTEERKRARLLIGLHDEVIPHQGTLTKPTVPACDPDEIYFHVLRDHLDELDHLLLTLRVKHGGVDVVILAEKEVPYARLAEVLEACHRAGCTSVQVEDLAAYEAVGGPPIRFRLDPIEGGPPFGPEAVDDTLAVLKYRLNTVGIEADDEYFRADERGIYEILPKIPRKDRDFMAKLLGRRGVVRVVPVVEALTTGKLRRAEAPGGESLWLLEDEALEIEGTPWAKVVPSRQPGPRQGVKFSLRGEVARAFTSLTEARKGGRLAFLLDDDVVSVVTVKSAITGEAVIEGNFSEREAFVLCELLGEKPPPLRVVVDPDSPR